MGYQNKQDHSLETAFSNVSRHKSSSSFVPACEALRRFAKERVDLALRESSQRAAMERILFAYLNPGWNQDDCQIRYVVAQPEPWNRVPENVRTARDLSVPTGDIFIGINPACPTHFLSTTEETHPLSYEAIRRILRDEETRDLAPNKSTSTSHVYLHDLAIIQYKAEGAWECDQVNGEYYSRSNEMNIALAQTCNTAYLQLATMVELYENVELPTDGSVYACDFQK